MSLNNNPMDAFHVNPLGFLAEDRELELKRAACDDAQAQQPPAKRARPSLTIDISPFADWSEPYTMIKDLPLLSIPDDLDEGLHADAATPRVMPAASTMCSDRA